MTPTEKIRRLAETCDALRQELAASTAREERLREALAWALDQVADIADSRVYSYRDAAEIFGQPYIDARAVLGETAAREGQG